MSVIVDTSNYSQLLPYTEKDTLINEVNYKTGNQYFYSTILNTSLPKNFFVNKSHDEILPILNDFVNNFINEKYESYNIEASILKYLNFDLGKNLFMLPDNKKYIIDTKNDIETDTNNKVFNNIKHIFDNYWYDILYQITARDQLKKKHPGLNEADINRIIESDVTSAEKNRIYDAIRSNKYNVINKYESDFKKVYESLSDVEKDYKNINMDSVEEVVLDDLKFNMHYLFPYNNGFNSVSHYIEQRVFNGLYGYIPSIKKDENLPDTDRDSYLSLSELMDKNMIFRNKYFETKLVDKMTEYVYARLQNNPKMKANLLTLKDVDFTVVGEDGIPDERLRLVFLNVIGRIDEPFVDVKYLENLMEFPDINRWYIKQFDSVKQMLALLGKYSIDKYSVKIFADTNTVDYTYENLIKCQPSTFRVTQLRNQFDTAIFKNIMGTLNRFIYTNNLYQKSPKEISDKLNDVKLDTDNYPQKISQAVKHVENFLYKFNPEVGEMGVYDYSFIGNVLSGKKTETFNDYRSMYNYLLISARDNESVRNKIVFFAS